MTRSPQDERTLVQMALAGDLRAFDRLARSYRPALTALARQIVGPEQAVDVAQDTLIAAYKSLPRLRNPERFGSWLAAIARHRARRLGQGADERTLPLDELIASHLPSLQEQIATDHSVQRALEDLPAEVALVATLYYLQEWSTTEIARFLDLPLTTVKWRLHSARAELRPRLEHLMENHDEPN